MTVTGTRPLGGWEDDPESADAAPPRERRPDVAAARALLESATVPKPTARHWLGGRRRQAVAACVIVGAVGFIAFQGLTNATQYFLTTKQAVAARATLGTKPFRIEGTVEHDVRQTPPTTRFDIYAAGVTVPVVSSGSPPELFKPGVPVVLVGHWQGDTFASDQIMVKHSASYSAAHPGRLKSQLPSHAGGASP